MTSSGASDRSSTSIEASPSAGVFRIASAPGRRIGPAGTPAFSSSSRPSRIVQAPEPSSVHASSRSADDRSARNETGVAAAPAPPPRTPTASISERRAIRGARSTADVQNASAAT